MITDKCSFITGSTRQPRKVSMLEVDNEKVRDLLVDDLTELDHNLTGVVDLPVTELKEVNEVCI